MEKILASQVEIRDGLLAGLLGSIRVHHQERVHVGGEDEVDW